MTAKKNVQIETNMLIKGITSFVILYIIYFLIFYFGVYSVYSARITLGLVFEVTIFVSVIAFVVFYISKFLTRKVRKSKTLIQILLTFLIALAIAILLNSVLISHLSYTLSPGDTIIGILVTGLFLLIPPFISDFIINFFIFQRQK
jgi:hypothetical protein